MPSTAGWGALFYYDVRIDESPYKHMYTFMYIISYVPSILHIYRPYVHFVSPLCAEHSRMGPLFLCGLTLESVVWRVWCWWKRAF